MTKKKTELMVSRRTMLLGAGVAAGVAATAGLPGVAMAAGRKSPHWDMKADVVVVGSGSAGYAAAVTAAASGASVIVIEKMPVTGGTTGKSGGIAWIPNNQFMRAQGQQDKRDDCLRYMARFSFPEIYDANSKTLGLPERNYQLLAALYDNGSKMVEWFEKIDAIKFKPFKMWAADVVPPDYIQLPENKTPFGRALEADVSNNPSVGGSGYTGGRSMINQMEQFLQKRKAQILVEHRAVGLIKEGDRVVGLEVKHNDKLLRVQARKGVIFGSGGYAQNPELLQLHQPGVYGSCATPGATGDFIAIAEEAGAKMGFLGSAWRAEVILEQALKNRMLPEVVFFSPGDSTIHVNKYGKRVVNEKRSYNDRTRAYFAYDPVKAEYPSRFMFMVFDERTLNRYGGAMPIPVDKRESTWLIEGKNTEELTQNIKQRLASLAGKIGAYTLDDGFAANLDAAIERFNKFAEAGRDEDFDRGETAMDRVWTGMYSPGMLPPNKNRDKYPPNDKPSITMYPIDRSGPLYAVIMAPGAMDTCGGPAINANGQVLSAKGSPIPGLYGAGNCIAAPTVQSSMGAGGTLGPSMTFGYIAARHAVEQKS